MIYADFQSILVLENNGKQNPNEISQTNIKITLASVLVTE